MNSIRGERFNIDLDSDDEEYANPRVPRRTAPTAFDFVSDVKERATGAPKAPTAPTPKPSSTGFPTHKTRTRTSAFKQQRAEKLASTAASPIGPNASAKPARVANDAQAGKQNVETPEERERREIDIENRKTLSQMSELEIEQERSELFAGLSPALIQKLLRRANIDQQANEQPLDVSAPSHKDASISSPEEPLHEETAGPIKEPARKQPPKKVSFDEPAKETKEAQRTALTSANQPAAPVQPDTDSPDLPVGSVHFPKAPQVPELDPSDPNFNEQLHQKYFPDLAYDPSTLSWMSPPDPKVPSAYDPSHDALPISVLRFSFKGTLIPPTQATEIPVTEGLHHHGDAPEAAGYTLGELAVLARSVNPGQRCIAFQTLGRFLYRLGSGEFGVEGDETRYNVTMVDADHGEIREEIEDEPTERATLTKGLWEYVEELKITDILVAESNKESGHLSARTYAQEAVWNWKQGGGRKRRAV